MLSAHNRTEVMKFLKLSKNLKDISIQICLCHDEQKESLDSDTNYKYNFKVRNSQLKKLHSDYLRLQ